MNAMPFIGILEDVRKRYRSTCLAVKMGIFRNSSSNVVAGVVFHLALMPVPKQSKVGSGDAIHVDGSLVPKMEVASDRLTDVSNLGRHPRPPPFNKSGTP